jgi:hypothetical protein
MSSVAEIQSKEHIWCQYKIRQLMAQLNNTILYNASKLHRQKFDVRTQEYQIQQEVYNAYLPILEELNNELARKLDKPRIVPTHVSTSTSNSPTEFQKSCKQYKTVIDHIGVDTFDRFQRCFDK